MPSNHTWSVAVALFVVGCAHEPRLQPEPDRELSGRELTFSGWKGQPLVVTVIDHTAYAAEDTGLVTSVKSGVEQELAARGVTVVETGPKQLVIDLSKIDTESTDGARECVTVQGHVEITGQNHLPSQQSVSTRCVSVGGVGPGGTADGVGGAVFSALTAAAASAGAASANLQARSGAVTRAVTQVLIDLEAHQAP